MNMTMIGGLVFVFFVSLFFGSFYNVVGLRTLEGKNFVLPSSSCPTCNHKLGPIDLVPIFSFVFLGGKCRHCKAKISKIYPLGELLTAISYTLIFYVYRFNFSLEILTQLTFITFMIITTITDMKERIVPNKLIIFGILSVFTLRLISQQHIINYSIQGILSFGVLFLIFALSGGKMGGADVKIYALIGLSIGLLGAIKSLLYASIVALIFNIGKLTNKDKRKTEIPFFPFITIGILLVYLI